MQTKTGSRVVIIGSTSTATSNSTRREAVGQQRATPRRIIVIKDGQFVGGKPAR
jgi:hypothetical protein